MKDFYTVDGAGVFVAHIVLDDMLPRPRGSYTAPPVTAEGQFAVLTGGVWVVVDEYPAPPPEPSPTEISALAGLAVIDEFGMAEAYTAWATSTDRTFMERAFIDKATTWKRDNAALNEAATALGLTSEQMGAMFVRAKQLEAAL